MKIKQFIIDNKNVLIFTENPKEDIKVLQKAYEDYREHDKAYKFELGYEEPMISTFHFLGLDYFCISLWFDNEDIPDYFKNK